MDWKLKLFLKVLHKNEGFVQPFSMEEYRSDLERTWKRNRWWLDGPSLRLKNVEDFCLDNREGVSIRIRKYQHHNPSQKVVFYIHGGGWVGRSIDIYDNVCRRICKNTESTVYSIGYRLAPEHKFPKAIFDCVDVISELLDQERSRSNIGEFILCGDSAGGNMAIGVINLLSKRDITLDKLLLLYPPLTTFLDQSSMEKFGRGYVIEKPDIEWMRDMYLPESQNLYDPLLSPLFYEDLSFLPKTWVLTGGYDPFLDQALSFIEKPRRDESQIIHKHYPTLCHGFTLMTQLSPEVKQAYRDVYQIIRQ
ncbi:alpha/beta hydrolase [Membranihabitans marinus]|uniref:alpha/beta hydrolase n=1 Tax=Membranihabitans marinus TaxID=1227546 RepID=UPI001F35528C|nr:alpha/beta hydrolase [Membranihabitans marinus]